MTEENVVTPVGATARRAERWYYSVWFAWTRIGVGTLVGVLLMVALWPRLSFEEVGFMFGFAVVGMQLGTGLTILGHRRSVWRTQRRSDGAYDTRP